MRLYETLPVFAVSATETNTILVYIFLPCEKERTMQGCGCFCAARGPQSRLSVPILPRFFTRLCLRLHSGGQSLLCSAPSTLRQATLDAWMHRPRVVCQLAAIFVHLDRCCMLGKAILRPMCPELCKQLPRTGQTCGMELCLPLARSAVSPECLFWRSASTSCGFFCCLIFLVSRRIMRGASG